MDPSSPEAQNILRYYQVTYDDVIFYKYHHQLGIYLLLVGITVILWDHITTIQDEIKYVWHVKRRWTIATFLFAFNRYVSPLGFIGHFIRYLLQSRDRPMCGAGKLSAYLNIVSFACVEIVLMLRVWVMYGNSKKLGLFLGALLAVALVASLVIPSMRPPTVMGLVPPFPTVLTFCVRTPSSTQLWLFIIGLSVDTIIFSLFCIKVYLLWKGSVTIPILNALLTQGAAYYAVILCTFAISIPATMHKEIYIPLTDPNTVILISCIACSRLVLSLRGLYYGQMVVDPTNSGTVIKGEYRHSTQISMSYTSSTGAVTLLGTSMSEADERGA